MQTAPFCCRLCGAALASAEAWRRHAKSDAHVAALRRRLRGAGSETCTGSAADGGSDDDAGTCSSSSSSDDDDDDDDDDERDGPDARRGPTTPPDFVAGQCLFCDAPSDGFDESLVHMRRRHGFTIPFRDRLVVDEETLVRHLHLVIHADHECISCARRRASASAVQQRMAAKGHCRLDVSADTADFYREASPRALLRAGETAARRRGARSRGAGASSTTTPAPSTGEIARAAVDAAAVELARLSARDRTALAHLPRSEARALLAVGRRQLEGARRAERRDRARVEGRGNRVLMRHFKNDVPGRVNG